MKNSIYLVLFILSLTPPTAAQEVPDGMHYQAIIRDAEGILVAKKKVQIEFELFSPLTEVIYFAETHTTETDQYGMLRLIIGQGQAQFQTLDDVPWSTEKIWLRMSTLLKGSKEFETTTETALYSVPYALHAKSATSLVDADWSTRIGPKDIPWTTDGNANTYPDRNYIGTSDAKDLIVKTNSQERIRVFADGGVRVIGDHEVKGNQVTTGSAEVYGSVEIGNQLQVGSDIFGGGNLDLSGEAVLNQLEVSTNAEIGENLTVKENATIEKDLVVFGTSELKQNTGIGIEPNDDAMLWVKGDAQQHLAFFENTNKGDGDGIGIQLGRDKTNGNNNFLTFYNGAGDVTGRIEGYDVNVDLLEGFPVPSEQVGIEIACLMISGYNPVVLGLDYVVDGLNVGANAWNGAVIPGWPIPDVPSITIPQFTLFGGIDMPSIAGVGIPDVPSIKFPTKTIFNGLAIPDVPPFPLKDNLGEWATLNSLSSVLADVSGCPDGSFPDDYPAANEWLTELTTWAFTNDARELMGFSKIEFVAKAGLWTAMRFAKDGGITYGSKGADYAEYLPKLNSDEIFMPGEIVGVHGGQISKATEGADQILAISSIPIVLGNQPKSGQESNYEKVGFLGQVPVFVKGKVNIGDFILASGNNDGMGIAKSSEDIALSDLDQIIGKAWSASRSSTIDLINVSIGLKPSEFVPILKKQENRMNNIEVKVNQLISENRS